MKTKKICQMGPWLWQAWPLWAFLVLILATICTYKLVHYDWNSVHRVAGPILQVVGGAFVLFSINKNLGVFQQGTLSERITRWWASCPFRRTKPILLQPQEGFQIQESPPIVILHKARENMTLEERINDMQVMIDQCRQGITSGYKALQIEIDAAREALQAGLSTKSREISQVESLVASAVVGGVNTQVFGILLVFYGTLLPIIRLR